MAALIGTSTTALDSHCSSVGETGALPLNVDRRPTNGIRSQHFHLHSKWLAHTAAHSSILPPLLDLLTGHIDGRLVRDAQDHYELRNCTRNQLSTRRKKPLDAAAPLFLMVCMRACVLVVLHARFVCTESCTYTTLSFTDVRTRPVGIGIARTFTKSEYAQPPVLVSRSLFDTYIASRRPASRC